MKTKILIFVLWLGAAIVVQIYYHDRPRARATLFP